MTRMVMRPLDKKEDATAPWNRYMRPLSPEERKANGVSRPAALETAVTVDSGHTLVTETNMSFKSSPSLQPGDVADMWHEGTRKFYRVTVQHQVTEEEAIGG